MNLMTPEQIEEAKKEYAAIDDYNDQAKWAEAYAAPLLTTASYHQHKTKAWRRQAERLVYVTAWATVIAVVLKTFVPGAWWFVFISGPYIWILWWFWKFVEGGKPND